jgi:hypothetical protein
MVAFFAFRLPGQGGPGEQRGVSIFLIGGEPLVGIVFAKVSSIFRSRSLMPIVQRVARWSAGGVVLVGAAACTEFAPGDDVLPSSADNFLMGDVVPGEDFRCVTPASVDASNADLVTPVDQTVKLNQPLQFLTLGRGEVPAGAQVHACALADVECTEPLTIDYPLTPEGWVNLPLSQGFNGYIEIRGDTILPTMLFLGEPLRRPRPTDYPIALVERSILPGISGAAGTMQNATTGLLTIRVFDCEDVSASGVRFSQQQEGVRWYYVNGLPSSAAEETGTEGLGGFINTPPGVSIISTTGSTGQPLASRKSVAVRADWMTALRMWVGEEAAP